MTTTQVRTTRLSLLALSLPAVLGAQSIHSTAAPEIRAVRLTGTIALDGRLEESIWRTAPAAAVFRQLQPNEGNSATQRTEVRFVYDDEALYVGARMHDDLGPDGVKGRLVRRDGNLDSDYLEVIFDPITITSDASSSS